jgi:hypothetical protein
MNTQLVLAAPQPEEPTPPQSPAQWRDALQQTFREPGAFLYEVLRYIVRSHAQALAIHWDERTHQLTIASDGDVICEFDPLLLAGTESWDFGLLEQQHPFGMAFAALLFSSERFIIDSGTTTLAVRSAQFLSKRQAFGAPRLKAYAGLQLRVWLAPEACPQPDFADEHATQVTVLGGWRRILRRLALGFALPVHFAGAELPRPFALSSLPFKATALGKLYVKDVGPATPELMPVLFYGGLPIEYCEIHTTDAVLHLNERSFAPQLPNRKWLRDRCARLAHIQDVVNTMRKLRLYMHQSALAPEVFLDRYWEHCLLLEMPDLLASGPLTAPLLAHYREPVSLGARGHLEHWGDEPLPGANALFVTDLHPAHCRLQGLTAAPLASLFAKLKRLPVLSAATPSNHWAHLRTVNLLNNGLRFVVELEEPAAPLSFVSPHAGGIVQLCRAFSIRCELTADCKLPPELQAAVQRLGTVRTEQDAVFDFDGGRYVIAHGAERFAQVLLQQSNYRNDDAEGDLDYGLLFKDNGLAHSLDRQAFIQLVTEQRAALAVK